MMKLKALFYIYKNSLTNPSYYAEIVTTNIKFSLKYFFSLALVATGVFFVFSIFPSAKDLDDLARDLRDSAVAAYPQDLVISIKDGEMSINKPEPYFIEMPQDESTQLTETPENAVVFDSAGTLNDLAAYDTLILVNKENILVQNTNKVEVYPLKDFPDKDFTAQEVQTLATTLDPFIKALPYIAMALMLVMLFTYFFGIRLFYLLFVALVLLVIGKIRKTSLSFTKYYQIGMHAITLPITIEVIAGIVGFPMNYPFWFTALTLLMGIIGLVKINSQNQTN